MMKTINVSIMRRDRELNAALKKLQKSAIYVGIAEGSKRDKRDDPNVTKSPDNHLLGFVHENGSPANNIPPRPFLVPGIEHSSQVIVAGMKRAIKQALNGNEKDSAESLEQTAIRAASAVKNYMQTASFEPLKPETIANRNRSRQTIGKRKNEKLGIAIKPLINTGQLRNAIDGVVVEE